MPDKQHKAAALGFAAMHHPGDHALIAKLKAKAKRKGLRCGGPVEGFRHDGEKGSNRADRKPRG